MRVAGREPGLTRRTGYNYLSYGVVKSKWAATRETLGQGQGIWHFYAWQEDGYAMRVGHFSESAASCRAQGTIL